MRQTRLLWPADRVPLAPSPEPDWHHGTGSAAERSSGCWKCFGHCCLLQCDPGEVGKQVVALPQLGDLAQGEPMAVARSGCASQSGQQGP